MDLVPAAEMSALVSVITVDVALAGDNAVVVGMAAAGLPAALRTRAIVFGIATATILRIVFAGFTTQLLKIDGLLILGGLLLLWVAWKLWAEMRDGSDPHGQADASGGEAALPEARAKSFLQALGQIIVADVSMSLDNVLAVAGAAREHVWVLIIGLAFSVALMGMAATLVARLLRRHRWIIYIGLGVILYIAQSMLWDGGQQVLAALDTAGLPQGE